MTIPMLSEQADLWLKKYKEYHRALWVLAVEGTYTQLEYTEITNRWWQQRPWYVRVVEWMWLH